MEGTNRHEWVALTRVIPARKDTSVEHSKWASVLSVGCQGLRQRI